MARKITTKKATSAAVKPANNKKVQKTVVPVIEQKMDASKLVEEKVSKTSSGGRSLKIHRSTVLIVLGIVLLGLILYYGRGFFVAAVVNGQPVSRLSLIEESERQSGKQAMSMLVRNILVEQEASRQNVKVSEKDVDDQIKTIEKNFSKQGQNLDDMLKLEGMSRDQLDRIVMLDLLVGKLVEKEIKITDKDIDSYIKENEDILPKDQKGDALRKTVRERIKQEQLPRKAQEWFTNLEEKANIIKFVNY